MLNNFLRRNNYDERNSNTTRRIRYKGSAGTLGGIVARTIEQQTAKLPSDIFLWGALGSIGISLYFELRGDAEKSRFIGQWVSPFLLLGVSNKLVKIAGSDRTNN